MFVVVVIGFRTFARSPFVAVVVPFRVRIPALLPRVVFPATLFRFSAAPLMLTVPAAFPRLVLPVLLMVETMRGALQVVVPFKVSVPAAFPILVFPAVTLRLRVPFIDKAEVPFPIVVLPPVLFRLSEAPLMLTVPAAFPRLVLPAVVFRLRFKPSTFVVPTVPEPILISGFRIFRVPPPVFPIVMVSQVEGFIFKVPTRFVVVALPTYIRGSACSIQVERSSADVYRGSS